VCPTVPPVVTIYRGFAFDTETLPHPWRWCFVASEKLELSTLALPCIDLCEDFQSHYGDSIICLRRRYIKLVVHNLYYAYRVCKSHYLNGLISLRKSTNHKFQVERSGEMSGRVFFPRILPPNTVKGTSTVLAHVYSHSSRNCKAEDRS
jgi:hypothetical protein